MHNFFIVRTFASRHIFYCILQLFKQHFNTIIHSLYFCFLITKCFYLIQQFLHKNY